MQFSEISGNADVKAKLIKSVANNRIPHAQLFLGKEGSGALSMARAFAQYVFCENRTENDSCGTCPSCRKIETFSHPDLHFSYPIILSQKTRVSEDYSEAWREMLNEGSYYSYISWLEKMDAANKQATIPKDEADNVFKKLSLKSYEGGVKMLVMWMPELMNNVASNKLLKIIEEPPANTLIVLVSNDDEKIITTIRSRTQLTKISLPTVQEGVSYLNNTIGIGSDAGEELIHLSERNLHKAIWLSKNMESGNTNLDMFIKWMRLCYKRSITDTVLWVDEIARFGREEQKNFLQFTLSMFRQCIVGHYTDGKLSVMTPAQKAFLDKFAPFINHMNIVQLSESVNDTHYYLERNGNAKIMFMDLSLKIFAQLKKKL